MKVVVTGANGFIGSHVVDKLIKKGYDVEIISRKNSDLSNLEEHIKINKIKINECNFSDIDSLANAVSGSDYIYHIGGAVAAKNWEGYKSANVDATTNLIEAALKTTPNLLKFLFVSSQTAAGPSMALNKPKTELDEMNPISQYGKSKKLAEEEVAKYYNRLPIATVRPPAVFGPRDKAILDVFKTVNSGLGAMIGFDKKYVSLINCFDLADGIILAAESEKSIGQKYFISSDEFYTWDYLIPLIGEKLNKKFVLKIKLPHSLVKGLGLTSEKVGNFFGATPVFNYEKANDFIQSYWTCSIDKAKSELNYQPKIKIDEGIEITVDWYKKHKWL
jgi:nucleoside-diphosphate-sugar epimerase